MRVISYGDNDFREYLLCPFYQINMAVGNRVKRTGVNRFLTHLGCLSIKGQYGISVCGLPEPR